MKSLKVALFSAALAVPSFAFASSWDSEATHSNASFSVRHLSVSDVRGDLGAVTSVLELDDKDITKSKVEATIDLAAINTRVEKRDTHLKSADFFDVAKFPTLKFKSTKIEKAGEKYKITGDLTIKEITKPVTLEATITPEIANPFSKAATRGVNATGSIPRKDFGLTWNVPLASGGLLVGEDVKISLDVEYVKREAKTEAKPAAPAKK
jgi:polyisoprenoid-binding protein YceI